VATPLVTPMAVLLGWLLLDEVPPGLALVGGFLSLAGVYVARRTGSSARKSPIVSAPPGSLSDR
jgi:drug/metabolite transporter (DMT)-like permease